MFYVRLDLVMVRQMVGEAAAGTYAAAVRLSELWFFLPVAVASSLLPGVLRARASGRSDYRRAVQRLFDLNTGVAYALAIPTVLLAPWLVRFAYGPAYAASTPVLIVHGWTLVWAASGVARGQFCVNEGLTRLHLIATAAGALLNVLMNLLLIPRYGGVGAAWATFAAQAVAAWISSFWFAATRDCARMQTLALLIPMRWSNYVQART
jgi:O-antigen/teichoic acid export membrane protein